LLIDYLQIAYKTPRNKKAYFFGFGGDGAGAGGGVDGGEGGAGFGIKGGILSL